VTGETWITQTLGRALRTSNPRYEDLREELVALVGAGTLTREQASHAGTLIETDERNRSAVARQAHERRLLPPAADDERLEATLQPDCCLVEVGGVTVALACVELWTHRLNLRLEVRRSRVTDELDAKFDADFEAFERIWVQDRASIGAGDVRPPDQPGTPLLSISALPLSVSDDLGSRYHAFRSSTGGEHRWRSDWTLEPAVPPAATALKIALETNPTRERSPVELTLPPRT
jgi:hypothetical protein